MSNITVTKRDEKGADLFSYEGTIVERGETWVCLRAVFGRADHNAGYVTFRHGDIMTEWFYSDRWYNIFRMQDVDTGALKGWYCNVTRPATLTEDTVSADDLALDLFVSPDGAALLLDEDEFAALDLSADDRAGALKAIDRLLEALDSRVPPFDELPD